MSRSDEPDAAVTARLTTLVRPAAAGGWVPEQPAAAGPTPPPPPPPAAAAPRSLVTAAIVDRLPLWLRSAALSANTTALMALAAVCVVCIAVTTVMVLRAKSAAPPPAAAAPLPLPSPAAASPAPEVVVDVGGRVRKPGLVTLSPGARVADALRAAGGALRHRDLLGINLAARVSDGQLLLVGLPATAAVAGGASGGGAGAAAGPVNLNSATVDQLDTLPGIGPVLAQRIIDWRTAHGGFRQVSDLDQVSGIGDSTFADLAPLVTV